jgi:Ca2+-binding RTX toxin-like protein
VALIEGEIIRNPADTDYSSVDQWVITHNGGDLEIDVWTDIDVGGTLNSSIILFRIETDGSFTRIDRNNDGGNDGAADGSTNNKDSYLSLTGLDAGSYLIAIGADKLSDSEATTTTLDFPNKEKDAGEYRITLTGDVEVPSLASQTYLQDPGGHATIVEDGVPRPDTVELIFTVTLDAAPTSVSGPVSVDYQTNDGSAIAVASSDGDYDAIAGTLVFDIGETVKTVTVLVNADGSAEADESFTLDLFNLSSNASYSVDGHVTGSGIQGIGSIYEEDQLEVGTETPVIGGSGNDVLAGDVGGVTILQAAVNAVYVIDVSGSMAWDAETGSTTITTQVRMDVVKDSLTRLNELYQNLTSTGTPAVVTYITYSSSASMSTTFDLAVEADFAAAQQFLQDLVPGGGTNQGAAVDLLSDYLQNSGQLSGESDVYLLTDGYPSGYVSNALRANADLNAYLDTLATEDVPDINAIAIGNGVDPADVDTYLDPIDNTDNPDGSIGAQVVVDANDLPEVLLANFELAPVSNDTILGESGNDIIFGDVINTDHLTGVEGLGYPGLVNHLAETLGHEPSQQEIHDYIAANHETLNKPGDARGGDDLLDGGDGDDVLYGQGGMDTLLGGVGDDTLDGGEGNDILIGGSGDDILVGAGGADLFVWEAGDQGSVSDPPLDVVKDFAAEDTLDLRDLLIGEDADNLTDYLHFEQDGGNAVLHISSGGGFSAGYAAAAEDQTIVLENVDISGLGSDQQIIDALIAGNNLITD